MGFLHPGIGFEAGFDPGGIEAENIAAGSPFDDRSDELQNPGIGTGDLGGPDVEPVPAEKELVQLGQPDEERGQAGQNAQEMENPQRGFADGFSPGWARRSAGTASSRQIRRCGS
jgi:hypothetical protein